MNILNFHTFFYYDNTEWGQFGTYDMEIAADGKSMKGSYVGILMIGEVVLSQENIQRKRVRD